PIEPRGTKPTVSFPFGIPILPSTAKACERRCCRYKRKQLKAHQQEHVPAPPPVEALSVPERCSPSRVRFAAPNCGAPLTAARRSGQITIATGGSGGNMRCRRAKHKKQNRLPESLTGSLHISSRTAGPRSR